MWRSVLLFVPKALAFLAILLIGYLVARVVRRLVDALLTRVGFDRAVERPRIGARLAGLRYDASDILARLAYYAILLFALQLAFGVWGPNPISDLISAVVGWLPRAFVAIVIVVVATAIASAVRDLITGALGGLSYGRVIATVVWVFIVGARRDRGAQPGRHRHHGDPAGAGRGARHGRRHPDRRCRRRAGPADAGALGALAGPDGDRVRGDPRAGAGLPGRRRRRRSGAGRRGAPPGRRVRGGPGGHAATTVSVPRGRYSAGVAEPAGAGVPARAAEAGADRRFDRLFHRRFDAGPTAVADPAAGATPTPPPPDDETAGERTQVIPRADIEAASVPPADRSGPVAGAMPPPAPEATRELPAVGGDDGAIYQSGSVPDPSVDGNGPAKTPVEDDETQVIRRPER